MAGRQVLEVAAGARWAAALDVLEHYGRWASLSGRTIRVATDAREDVRREPAAGGIDADVAVANATLEKVMLMMSR